MANVITGQISAIATVALARGHQVQLLAAASPNPTFRAQLPAAAGALTHGVVITGGAAGETVQVQPFGEICPVIVDGALAAGTALEALTDGRMNAVESGDERMAIMLEASTAADQIVTALVGSFGRAP
jgi:hypothetical protein